MSQRIKLLDPHCVNQIAAGEVVERPLSVVKELAENALDAAAKKIDISIQGGGTSLIKIRDDGIGILPDDLRLAVLPHATSKIKNIDDLARLHTLGFRGEALPSIASVSKLSILSRTPDHLSGFEIKIEGGRVLSLSEAASPMGTLVTVQDLFFNTPARHKFLRSPASEFGFISDTVCKLALARPDVSFSLKNPNKMVLSTPGNGNLLEAIAAVLGNDTARKLIPLTDEKEDLIIHGYISPPELVRSARTGLTFIVNGRVIRSQILANALKNGYHTLIPSKTYPIAVISLTLSPSEVDVNVHPAKLEIKFKDERQLSDSLTKVVRNTLLEYKSFKNMSTLLEVKPREMNTQEQLGLIYHANDKRSNPVSTHKDRPMIIAEERGYRHNYASAESIGYLTKEAIFYDLRPLGQIFGTYILATDDTNFFIIDQHAAHERIRYENLVALSKKNTLLSQLLLIPETIELTLQEEQAVLANLNRLRDLGFIIEHFGGRTYLLRGVPLLQNLDAPARIFKLFIDEILTKNELPTQEKLLEEWIFTIACRTSIKGNERLSIPAMEELIQSLGSLENPNTCPHGRPILIKISKSELDRMFCR